jgi:RimJ/RimL family protein N-acetyltransferase
MHANAMQMQTERLPRVMLRPAQAIDCERIYEWNFAPDVRARSLTADIVAFADHAKWFAKRLPESRIWVIEEFFRAVGTVRIDQIGGVGRISIALGANARGRGIGKAAIALACAGWRYELFAEIADDNEASRRAFEACNFRALCQRGTVTIYQRNREP